MPQASRSTAAVGSGKKAVGRGRFLLCAVAGASVLSSGLAACGNTSHSTQPAAAATQTRSCPDQVHAWAHGEGMARYHRFLGDLATFGKLSAKAAGSAPTLSASQQATLRTAAKTLETSVQAAAAIPPPTCGDAADYSAAMRDYEKTAKDFVTAYKDTRSHKYGPAAVVVNAALSASQLGARALNRASASLKKLGA